MNRKQEALERIAAAKLEIEEAQKIIEAEDRRDAREEWVGKIGFISDTKPDLSETYMGVLQKIVAGDEPFIVNGVHWRYFRPATLEELGVNLGIRPDWSKAPGWAMSGAFQNDGLWVWMESDSPIPGENGGWNNCGKYVHVDCGGINGIIDWRSSLCKRPESRYE